MIPKNIQILVVALVCLLGVEGVSLLMKTKHNTGCRLLNLYLTQKPSFSEGSMVPENIMQVLKGKKKITILLSSSTHEL